MKRIIYIILISIIIFNGCCTPKKIRSKNLPVMELRPKIEFIDKETIVFILEAKRNSNVEGEYMPSSENFRVEILSDKGEIIWSSNYNMDYLQSISNVKPEAVGATYHYMQEWNRKKNNGNIAKPGKYEVRLTIPSRPYPYMVITEMVLD